MVCQQQLNDHFSDGENTEIMGNDIHPFPHVIGAGGEQFSPAVTFHHADAADAAFAQIRMLAEGGDAHINFPGGFQNPRAFGYGNRYAVNG